jgi:hypothetical protein
VESLDPNLINLGEGDRQYCEFNSGLCTCQWGALPLEPCLQPKQDIILLLAWFFFFFYSIGVWNMSFPLARQALYCLSNSSSPSSPTV